MAAARLPCTGRIGCEGTNNLTDIATNDATDNVLPLRTRLAKAERTNKIKAFLLVAPLLAFILVVFAYPIALMIYRSVDDPVAVRAIPQTLNLLEEWAPEKPPEQVVYETFGAELAEARKSGDLGKLATRLNYDIPGTRSALTRFERKVRKGLEPGQTYQDLLLETDAKWGQVEIWSGLKALNSPLTDSYFLISTDFRRTISGTIERKSEKERIFVRLFVRTLWVSLLVTGICVFLAYPISYQLATLPTSKANLLLILVLLPFWTSLLVRTTSWIVLLQTNGVLNDFMVGLGILSDENRIQMIYNMNGTVVAMSHILLPFMVLPLYSVMKTIPSNYLRAARSLGATPARAWVEIFLPLTAPGVGAGSILVFIMCIGYYITPALVGGRTGQLISSSIAYHMQTSLNWGLASALGTILLICVLLLYWLYNRIAGTENLKMG
ncbi:MAG: ABC transporter permease subunit [Proteobacteria bacterium]|nr:ABC transporter permease subunit [Pseudomonadota bacterium]